MHPSFYSMSEFNEECDDQEGLLRNYRSAMDLYELIILNESLHDIHKYVIKALSIINDYKINYNCDWKYFATQSRMTSLNESFSGNEKDYSDDECLIPRYSEDREDLRHYTILNELSYCFSDNGTRGDYLGTSTKEDFDVMSNIVETRSNVSIFKFFEEQGNPIPSYIYHPETGEMKQLSLADKIEREMNEDIQNKSIVDWFGLVIDKCQESDTYFKSLDQFSDNREEFNKLESMLKNILNLTF